MARWTTAILLAVGVATLASSGCRKDSPGPARWQWHPGGLAEALAAARTEGRLALVEVGASWCPTCHALERDVFDRNAGRLPTASLVAGRVDFDTPEGQSVARRYRVLGLPTTLILDPDGTVRGRIEGYDDVDSYATAVADAVRGGSATSDPKARAAAAPDDPAVAAAAGADLIARGDEAEGIRLLERARALDPEDRIGAWRDATRVLGRFQARAKGDPAAALPFFQEGAARAADPRARWGFAYWTAMMLHASGRPEQAARYLDALQSDAPGRPEPLAVRAEFLWMTGGDAATGLALAREAARLAPTDDGNQWLVAVLAVKAGDRSEARQAIDRALAITPGEAIYEDFRDRLAGTP